MIRLLSHIVQEYSFRLPLVLSPTVRMHYQCDQLEGALKSLGLLDITEESIVHGSTDSDSINYPSKKRYRREVQGYPANETVIVYFINIPLLFKKEWKQRRRRGIMSSSHSMITLCCIQRDSSSSITCIYCPMYSSGSTICWQENFRKQGKRGELRRETGY